jgi:hypothetical protein
MVYDPERKKIVMFGGGREIPPGGILGDFGLDIFLNDTWVYSGDGTNGFWVLQQQASNIPPRHDHGMVWDSFNKVVLVHGGYARGIIKDSWSWDGTNWFSLLSGPPLWGFGMAFDTERATAMIVGGFTSDENHRTEKVWEKPSNTGWEDRGPGPSVRAQLAMAYDERRKRTVIVGGVGESVETGETAYEYIPGRGWIIIPSLPSGQGRAGARMVYDSKRGVMVLTGGAGGGAPNASSGGRYSDTWELWPALFISGQPLDATNEVCTTATFSAGVQGNPPFQFSWLRDGKPLAGDERYIGADTAELKILSVRHSDAGKYELVVRDSCDPPNVVTSRVAKLTTKPESEWVFRTTNGPSARFAHGMVYDRARGVTVLFGGQTISNSVIPFNDLWEWDGARWTNRVPNSITNGWVFVPGTGWQVTYTNFPVRRTHFAMAYDSERGRTLIFGGVGTSPNNSPVSLRDLWEWDGATWDFRGTNGPMARNYGSMAYDEKRHVTVLFGGQSLIGLSEQPDTELVWEWDGNRWRSNRPPANPSALNGRTQSRMTYDSYRNVIVFGPTLESYSHWSFWDWDGTNWSNFPVVHFTDPIVSVLHGTSLGGFAFDANRRRSVWFGGQSSVAQNKTALFDGKDWTFFTNSTPPPPRTETAMAYDLDRRVLVMFGGNLMNSGAPPGTNDTWELAAVDAPVIREHPTSQIRAAGETATFRVSASGHGFVAYQWYFQNNLIVGAQTDTLTIPTVGEQNVGEYYVRIGSQCGSVTSRVATLTLDQKLQILSSAAATTLIWPPDANVVVETADSVNGPWAMIPNPPNPFDIGTFGPGKFFRLRRN